VRLLFFATTLRPHDIRFREIAIQVVDFLIRAAETQNHSFGSEFSVKVQNEIRISFTEFAVHFLLFLRCAKSYSHKNDHKLNCLRSFLCERKIARLFLDFHLFPLNFPNNRSDPRGFFESLQGFGKLIGIVSVKRVLNDFLIQRLVFHVSFRVLVTLATETPLVHLLHVIYVIPQIDSPNHLEVIDFPATETLSDLIAPEFFRFRPHVVLFPFGNSAVSLLNRHRFRVLSLAR